MVELPEKCPVCGGKTEQGVLRAAGSGGPRVVWRKPDLNYWSGGGETLKRSFLATDFRGVRCPHCGIVIFAYEKETEEREQSEEKKP